MQSSPVESQVMPPSAVAESERLAWWVIAVLSMVVFVGVTGVIVLTKPQAATRSLLPEINAALNATATVLLVAGYVFIRQKRTRAHQVSMMIAFGISCLFLITYLMHHYQVGSVPFQGTGWIRPVYFAILIPHIVLAAPVVPLALMTLYRGYKGRFERHRRIARWAFPLWLYVSVSGVVVYLMLYHLGH